MNENMYEILVTDDKFPNKLKSLSPTVKRFFAYGDLDLLKQNAVTVVGSRNCSDYGKMMAKKITEELVKNDIVIISGLALGIDSIAHETCILNGGKTIAVLGSGLKNIYPKENERLFKSIIDSGGLVLSEYPIDAPVQKKNFPMRNRILSGLSNGVVVIEATYRSGTSITAKYAKLQGKDVFCIPNSFGNKNSRGIIDLLKNGAKLVTSGDEIVQELGLEIKRKSEDSLKMKNEDLFKKLKSLGDISIKIYNLLKINEFLDCEKISQILKLDIIEINQTLTMMELEDIVQCVQINKYKLRDEYCE
ncbi:MAG: DNA-processing protein DprA [Clostridia bacterium]|nr:DNA-processing protein DprA [Clostridia bacterium]